MRGGASWRRRDRLEEEGQVRGREISWREGGQVGGGGRGTS